MPRLDRHKRPPIPFRPPEGDRLWLLAHAKQTGQPVNRVLTEALATYRRQTQIIGYQVAGTMHHPEDVLIVSRAEG